jgi:hypothetical protein
MGSVWRAEHIELGTPTAVKLIDPAIAESPEALARFKHGAAGGELVTFSAGDGRSAQVVLTTTWTQYEIVLPAGYNDETVGGGVARGFGWFMNEPAATSTLYIDSIRWVAA